AANPAGRPRVAARRMTSTVSRPGVTVSSAANTANASSEEVTGAPYYSTVTDFARFLGWSTTWPRAAAISQASTCSGTVVTSGARSVGVCGTYTRWSAYGATDVSPSSAM